MNRLLFFGDRVVAYLTIYREDGEINETARRVSQGILGNSGKE